MGRGGTGSGQNCHPVLRGPDPRSKGPKSRVETVKDRHTRDT